MSKTSSPDQVSFFSRIATYPLLDALVNRRSRRFAGGLRLAGGPLSYASARPPRPLALDEQAALAFAGCGITGHALAELPYDRASGGNIIIHFAGRTVASGDAAHCVTMFVLDDNGAWMLRRPQDYQRAEVAQLAQAAREHRLTELYERARVPIADARPDVPRQPPFTVPFNAWAANLPGSTTFLPVAELTALAINVMLASFDESLGFYMLDDRNLHRPAGVARFARSRGGHLYDDPAAGRVATLGIAEAWLYEFAAIEQGAMLQNLALMVEALGLGGFPYFAAHPYAWPEALGFRMEQVPFSRTIGGGRLARGVLRLLGRDLPVPTAVGLERGDEVLIKPFCPPYYPSMEQAVLAFVDYKCAPGRGTQADGGAASPWRDGAAVQQGIPRPSDRAVEATIACCEYIYRRYGRFPRGCGPFRTVLAFQAAALDPDFYSRFYRPDSFFSS